MVLNLPQLLWQFIDAPYNTYDRMAENYDGLSMAHVECAAMPSNNAPTPISPQIMCCEPAESSDVGGPSTLPPIEGAVTTPKRARTFDGYSPNFTNYMFQDAIQTLANAEVPLLPHFKKLFPGYTGDEIGLNSFDLHIINSDTIDDDSKRQLMMEIDLG